METTADAIFIKGNRILFEKRRKDEDNYAGLWGLPGGHKKTGEAIKKTLSREMKEELDVEIKKAKFAGKIKHTDTTSKKTYVHNYFLCTEYTGKIKKTYEQKKIKWLKQDKIIKLYEKGKLTEPDFKILKKLKIIDEV